MPEKPTKNNEKNSMMYSIPPKAMVLWVLGMYRGHFLSVREIEEKILKHFEYKICRQTVLNALIEHDYATGIIIEKTERRGKLRFPTKVYTTIDTTNNN